MGSKETQSGCHGQSCFAKPLLPGSRRTADRKSAKYLAAAITAGVIAARSPPYCRCILCQPLLIIPLQQACAVQAQLNGHVLS